MVRAQDTLPESEYKNLYTIQPYDVSSNGDVVYRKIFGDKSSQFFLKTSTATFELPQLDPISNSIEFYSDTLLLASNSKKKVLYLINPVTQEIDSINRISSFKIDHFFNCLIYGKVMGEGILVTVFDLRTKKKYTFLNKTNIFEEIGSTLVFSIDSQVSLFDLKSKKASYIYMKENATVDQIIYQKRKKLLGVIYQNKCDVVLSIYNTKAELQKNIEIPNMIDTLELEKSKTAFIDDQYISVSYKIPNKQETQNKELEIWYTKKPFYSQNYTQKQSVLGVLNIKNDSLTLLESTDNNITKMFLDTKYFVEYDPELYDNKILKSPYIKLIIRHIERPEFKTILDSIPSHYFTLSDHHKGVFYFKNRDWYFCSLLEGQVFNITKNLDDHFFGTSDFVGLVPRSRIFLSLKDNKTIYFSGSKNIYLLKDDPKNLISITNINTNSDLQYTISAYNKIHHSQNNTNQTIDKIDDSLGLLLDYTNEVTGVQGLELINNGKAVLITEGNFKIDNIIYSNERIVYTKTKQNIPPSLCVFDLKSEKESVLLDTRDQLSDYLWSKTEVIRYKLKNGRELKGLLYYPAEYNPQKKYPLIIDIYEKKFKSSYSYDPPSYWNSEGVNYNLWTQHNYFVFSADIENYGGNPGAAALESVLSGVEKVTELSSIDKSNIGLIGHSYGGFEVGYIIGRTKLFKTAVSGAGVHNAISEYLSVKKNWRMFGYLRFESSIFKMNSPLQYDVKTYLDITNVMNLSTVYTPILLWTGFLDTNVSALQSFEYFTGLKRLNKKAVLLNFKNEDHVLLNPDNQVKLTQYVLDWFDYHLKGEDKKWIKL